jgi:hypothetical protein
VTARVDLGWERSNRPEKAVGALATAKQLINAAVVVSEAETRRMCGVIVGSKKERLEVVIWTSCLGAVRSLNCVMHLRVLKKMV